MKVGRHVFSCRSLLLSTTLLNDEYYTVLNDLMIRSFLMHDYGYINLYAHMHI